MNLHLHLPFHLPHVALPGAGRGAPGVAESTARSRGDMGFLLLFVGAVLVITLAVIALAEIGNWWVLVPVMLFDCTITGFMGSLLFRMLADEGE